jgi:hypothetical protein
MHTYIHTYIHVYIYVLYIQPTCHLGNKAGSEAAIRAPLGMRRRGIGGWGAARCHTGQVGHCPEHRPLLLPTGVAPLEVAALLEGGVAEEVEEVERGRSTRATRRRRRMRRPLIKRHSGVERERQFSSRPPVLTDDAMGSGVRCSGVGVQWPRRRISLRGCSFFLFSPRDFEASCSFGTPRYPGACC